MTAYVKIKLGLIIGEQVSRAAITLFHQMHTCMCIHLRVPGKHTHGHGRWQACRPMPKKVYNIFTRDTVPEGEF